MAPESQEP
jgi:hypothetical protein